VDVLPRCLAALCRQSVEPSRYETIVVDDGSTDQTAWVAEQRLEGHPHTRVVRIAHAGPAAARNAGARAARGALLLFTDADCEPAPDWIECLARAFDDPGVAGAKGTYRTRRAALVARFVQQEYQDKYDRMARRPSIDFVDTYSAAYRRDVFLASGGFDTAYTTASVEDQELSFRLASQGHRLVFVPDAVVYHPHDVTLLEYLRRKFGIGYWKALLLRRHPDKAVRDSHTPQVIKVQIGLLAGSLGLTLAAAFAPALSAVAIGAWLLLFLTMLPLLTKITRRDPAVLPIAPLMIVLRALGLGAGLASGMLANVDRVSARRGLVAIGLAGIGLRLAALFLFGLEQPPITFEYGAIARHLLDTGAYAFNTYGFEDWHASSFMPPLYPAFVALTMAVAGDQFFVVLRLAQVLVFALGCFFSYGITQEMWGRTGAALLAALGAAVYPPFVGHVAQASTAIFDVVLLQGFVFFALVGLRRGLARDFLAAGVWLGLAGLTRAPALVAAAAVPVGLAARRRSRAEVMRLTGVTLIGALAVLAPWLIRNLSVQGAPVLISTNGGINFWIGNHSGAAGEFDFAALAQMLDRTRGMSETERDAFFYVQATNFIQQRPGEFLGLLAQKLAYFLWFRPSFGDAYQELGAVVGPARVMYMLSYAVLLPLALVGVMATLRHWRHLAPVYVVVLGYSLVTIFFFVATRFRAPIEAYLIAFAAYALVWAGGARRYRTIEHYG
ncbi:MAG TPA: glycosyltransferase, partial [Anaerolineae bacterium]|nr:glycosyltransferase [Anaerolineae bacterium]